jgi:hypothetical protein
MAAKLQGAADAAPQLTISNRGSELTAGPPAKIRSRYAALVSFTQRARARGLSLGMTRA